MIIEKFFVDGIIKGDFSRERIPLFILFFLISFFLTFYFDFELSGFIFLFFSCLLVENVRKVGVNLFSLVIFSFILGFLCVSWMFFIVNYVGFFWGLIGVLLSSLVLGIFFFVIFFPLMYLKRFEDGWRRIIFAVFYSLYFALWNYLFFIMDDLGLSFLQFFYTLSSVYLFYPVFNLNPFLANFLIAFLVIVFDYRKWGIWLVLIFLNFVLKLYYWELAKREVDRLTDKLKSQETVLYFISTRAFSDFKDYRIRNEDLTFYKVSVAFTLSLGDKRSVFFLPEGSLSKDERYTFYLHNPNYSPAIRNLNRFRDFISQEIWNEFISNQMEKGNGFKYIFFNPTSVDYLNKKIYNSVVLVDLMDIFKGKVKEYQIYDKVFLVPFTERVPDFFKTAARFLSNWIVIFKYLDYSSGSNKKEVFNIDKISFRPLICFESFKYLGLKGNEGDFILVSSNDSWFINNPMLYLHMKSAKILSVSKRKVTVFLVNGYENRVFIFVDFTKKTRNLKNMVIF